ncbi:MAG: hypothetical protein SPK23_00550 [Eubacteriales bacterium]|nr:hypothetical protein [Clostridiales bacterium]MDY5835606.1 hypothetical protein [Eubacteriales bacterium]
MVKPQAPPPPPQSQEKKTPHIRPSVQPRIQSGPDPAAKAPRPPQVKEGKGAQAGPKLRPVQLKIDRDNKAHAKQEGQAKVAPADKEKVHVTSGPQAESKSQPKQAPERPAWITPSDKVSPAKDSQFAKAWQTLLASANLPKLATILALVTFLIVFALAPAFRFQNLAGTDLFLHSREDLLQASGLSMGQHFLHSYGGSLHALLTGRYEGAEKKILQAYPELRSLSVYFKFPATLYFEAEERIPLAFLDVNDTYITIDRFGVVTGSYQELPQGLPAIRGIEPVQMRVGESIKTNADEALKSCVAVMAALVEADFESPGGNLLLPQTQEIRSSGYQRILLTFQPEGSANPLRVTCSSTHTLKEDFLWLKKVLDSKVLQDKLPGNLDIYGSQLVFRPYKLNAQGEEESTGQDYVWQDEIFVPQEIAPEEEEPDLVE